MTTKTENRSRYYIQEVKETKVVAKEEIIRSHALWRHIFSSRFNFRISAVFAADATFYAKLNILFNA
jgi:hypothetical protein